MTDPLLSPARVAPDVAEGDAALHRFLACVNGGESDLLLGDLLERHARPIVTAVVRRKLGGERGTADAEDIAADVLARLVSRLLEIRSTPGTDPIASFASYVATAAHNGWHRYMRERFPVRTRLKNRMRYVTSRHALLALWADDAGMMLCGLRKWQGRGRSAPATERVRSAAANPDTFTDVAAREGNWRAMNEAELAASAVAWCGGPILLDDLVAAMASILGISDERQSRPGRETDDDVVEAVADPAPGILTIMAEREDLRWLWMEVQELPLRQRSALLLNLRDSDGRGVIGLLPLTGAASIRHIANVLEIPPAELAALWRDLPLDDHAIAVRLGVTRQQVINLRKSARERLGRRSRTQAPPHGSTAVRSASSMTKRTAGSSNATGLGQ